MSQKYEHIVLRSDSMFLINSLSKWCATWRQNGWKTVNGEDVKNRQDFEQILNLMDKIKVCFLTNLRYSKTFCLFHFRILYTKIMSWVGFKQILLIGILK